MSLSNALVSLWLLPVAVQIVLPLALLVGFLGKRFAGNFLGKKVVTSHQNGGVRQAV